MYGRACPDGDSATSANGGRVAQIGMMKNRPAMPPTGMHNEIALGTFTAGSDTSSAIDEIMPMAENVYAAGSNPIRNVKPPHPDKEVS